LPSPSNQKSWSFPHREKPKIIHVVVGVGVSILTYCLLSLIFRPFLAEAMAQLLSLGRIAVVKPLGVEPPSLVLTSTNGSELIFAITWQRSGLFSLIVFWLLFVFLAFPLEGSVWLKVIWLEFGSIVGLMWSFIRLSTAALVAYHFGAGAFALADFVASPMVDFLWVIPVWSLGLSWVVASKRKNAVPKRG